MLAIELLTVVALVALNGLLALSELAVVSSRRARLKAMADQGVPGAHAALLLAADPGRFLSAVQVGITLVGVLAGAVSGATLGDRLGLFLADVGLPKTYAESIGIGVVVVAITYLSVIVGELVPKQLALRDAERVAAAVAPAMSAVARLAGPVVTLLDASGRAVLRLIGVSPDLASAVTDEEIRAIMAEAESAGVIEPEERSMIAGVMRLGDRPVRAVMTSRRDVDLIDLNAEPDEIRRVLRESPHSRLPAARHELQEVIGIVQAKDLLDAYLAGGPVDPRAFVRPAPIVPDTIDALDVLATLKQSPVHIALVHDEYGHFQGIVTTADILEAITGAFRTEEGPAATKATRRPDGSWLIDGDMPADEMADLVGLRLPGDGGYHTVAGFILSELGRIPAVGEEAIVQGWRFEVVDLDGRRIDKVLAERLAASRRVAG